MKYLKLSKQEELMNNQWIHLTIWFLAGTFILTTTGAAMSFSAKKSRHHKKQLQQVITFQSKGDTLDAGRIRTGRFVHVFYRNGQKAFKGIYTIHEQKDGTYRFSGQFSGDQFYQVWTSTATSSLKPVSATLLMRQKGDTTFSMKIEYEDDHVSGTVINAGEGSSKAERHPVSTDLPPGTLVDQRIDWTVPLASRLEVSKELQYSAYNVPRSGVSEITGEVVGEERIQVPAGMYDTYHVIYNVKSSERTETYEVWVTKDIPRILVREKYPEGMISELVKTGENE